MQQQIISNGMMNNKPSPPPPSSSHDDNEQNENIGIDISSARRFRRHLTTTRSVLLLLGTAFLLSFDNDSTTFPIISLRSTTSAFTIAPNHASRQPSRRAIAATTTRTATTITTLFSSSTSSAPELPNITDMKSGEIRNELESYGISTKAFLEKKEMVAALEKARAEGKKPINGSNNEKKKTTSSSRASSSSSSSSSKSTSSSTTSSSKDSDSDGKNRAERIKEEMEKAKSMKVGELKKELQSRGISTKSFFEKSEFVKAYAEAIVDNVSSKKEEEEPPLDPDYRDVTMQKMPRGDPRLLQGTVIDIITA